MNNLDELIKAARHHKMTPREIYEQRVSWVWGMLDENDKRTKEDVEKSLAEMGILKP